MNNDNQTSEVKDARDILLHRGPEALRLALQPEPIPLLASPSPQPATDNRPAQLSVEAKPGVIGVILGKLMPTTEASEAAVLLNLLTAFGSIVGRVSSTLAGNSLHHANLFVVLCGDTAKGRKGTSWDVIVLLLEEVDATLGERVKKGLGTGQGVIHHVRDEEKDSEGKVTDPGVTDKRLLVVESEFAGALRQSRGRENTLSPVLRDAWDGCRLQTLTKNHAQRATGAHVSVIGHITKTEACDLLTATDNHNGFCNRFLWCYAFRSKELPFAVDAPSLEQEASELRRAVKLATEDPCRPPLDWSEDARPVWAEAYSKLSRGGHGMHGAVTARAEAHVKRLALVYALILGETALTLECLKAALAVWDYCDKTAEWIFGAAFVTNEARKIYHALRDRYPDRMTLTDIGKEVFSGHAKTGQIEAGLDELEGRRLIERQEIRTAGRSSTIIALRAE